MRNCKLETNPGPSLPQPKQLSAAKKIGFYLSRHPPTSKPVGVPKALDLAKVLEARLEPDPQIFAHIIQAKVQLQQGSRGNAVRLLEETLKILDSWLARFELGRVFILKRAVIQRRSRNSSNA